MQCYGLLVVVACLVNFFSFSGNGDSNDRPRECGHGAVLEILPNTVRIRIICVKFSISAIFFSHTHRRQSPSRLFPSTHTLLTVTTTQPDHKPTTFISSLENLIRHTPHNNKPSSHLPQRCRLNSQMHLVSIQMELHPMQAMPQTVILRYVLASLRISNNRILIYP
jgi:hypothetical protein